MKAIFSISGWRCICDDCFKNLALKPESKEIPETMCGFCFKPAKKI